MLSRRLLLGLVGAGLLAAQGLGGSAALARTPEARNAGLDAALRGLVENRSTPGIAVLILQDGRPVYSRSVGAREPGGSAPIGAADMVRLASMTKAVTSVAAMILVEEGRIGLDDPISRHLPEFAELRVRQADGTLVPATRPPTVRELLTHTAGFSYNFMNRPGIVDAYREARVSDGLAEPELSAAEAMRRLAAAPLAFQPGTEWHYSLATDVLGALVERVTGGTLGAFVAERIARPLRIESWVFDAPAAERPRFVPVTRPAQVTGALGTGYVPVTATEAVPFPTTRGTAVLDPERAFSPTAYHSGGGGMSGTLGDYARFAQMLLNGGELDGARILRVETVRQMTANATGAMPTLRGPGWGFGLGFGVVTDPAEAKTGLPAGSYGWGGIYGTQFWVDPTNRVVGVVMTQTAIIGSGPIANAVREAFYATD
jgi:CubicO group peptidase (beta-lactamase class C family)